MTPGSYRILLLNKMFTHLPTTTTITTIIQVDTTHPLIGSRKLQHLGDRAEIPSLVVSQTFGRLYVNYIECIRSDNRGVDVAIVDQITDYLHTHAHIHTNCRDHSHNVILFQKCINLPNIILW